MAENNSVRTLKHSTEEIMQSKGYQSFPINPYYSSNEDFNVSSSTVFYRHQSNISNEAKGKSSSLARSLSQGALLSITDQFLLDNRILLSPNSTLKNDLIKNPITRQYSTLHIDKLKKDLREYALSKEKSLNKEIKTKDEYTIQTKRIIYGGVMPPNDINEIEYCYF